MKEIRFSGEYLSDHERKNLNILETIRREGPTTKAEISKHTGINIVTVSNYIDDFVKRGLLFEKGLAISSGGRRPLVVELNSKSSLVIGVGLNLINMVGVLVDLAGNVLIEVKRERPNAGVKELVGCLVEIIADILGRSDVRKDKIKGVGIGIAGIVNKQTQTIRWPERVGDRGTVYAMVDVPLKNLLEKEFGLSSFVENDATVAVWGEQWLALEPDIRNLIYMYSGVGSGIMINGEVYRGTTGSAGEVSIHNPKENDKFNCFFGDPCLLKRREADLEITSCAKKMLSSSSSTNSSRILELAGGNTDKITLKMVFDAAKEADPLAVDLVRQAGERLGIKVAFLVNFLNPEMVIIGGGIEEAGPILLDAVRKAVDAWAFEEMAGAVKIVPAHLGDKSVALGAASMVIRNIFVTPF